MGLVFFCNSIRGGTCPLCSGRSGAGTGQGWGTLRGPEQPVLLLCPRPGLCTAALGLRSGDSRVFNQSSGTRDSPANASRPRGEALLWAGTAKGCPVSPGPVERRPRSSCTSSHGAPAPALSHTHTPRRARPALQQPQPSACGSSALHEIIASFLLPPLVAFTISSSARQGVPEVSLPPSAQLCALRAPKCCRLQPASKQLCHGACLALARSLTSLLLLLLLPFGLGLALGGRGDVRRGSRSPGTAPGAAGGSGFAPSHHLTSI